MMRAGLLVAMALVNCFCLTAIGEEWAVWIDDGESDPIQVKDYRPSTNLLDGYFDALKQICAWHVIDYDYRNSPEERAPYARDKITVTPIGKWEDYEVFEYAVKDIKQKSIVLKDKKGRSWILYTLFYVGLVRSDPSPVILSIDHQPVLAYETQTDGVSRHDQVRYYFVLDSITRKPKTIDESLIKKAAKDAVPNGLCIATMQGDCLDVREMCYSCLVGRSEGERHASDGSIEMHLTF